MDRSEAGKQVYERTKHIQAEINAERSRKIREAYEDNPKLCLFCGEMLPFEKRRSKFCNSSCSASYNNVGKDRHQASAKRLIQRTTVCSCGNPKLPNNKYCAECIEKRVYVKKATLETAKDDKTRRQILLGMRGTQCENCGLTEWMGQPIPLEMHHIDGDTDHNAETNLQLLCPNCHAITDTHKRRNKNGKRQQVRRQRYADGKTW